MEKDMRVLSYVAAAERASISLRTFERIIATGTGPAVIEITGRRRGVLEADLNEWLMAKRQPALTAASSVTPKRGRGRPKSGAAGNEAA
jgi:predicted DNA-binding transcriptional regulator AlpA